MDGIFNIPNGLFPKETPQQTRDQLDTAANRLNEKPAENLPGSPASEITLPGTGLFGTGNMTTTTPGFAVDLDGNGKFERGQDAVLGIDSNKDGKLDAFEVLRTNALLQAHAGASADLNKDGKIDEGERQRASSFRQQFAKIDKNHDGKLSNSELQSAGAQAWVDKNKDGKVDAGEVQNLNKIETGTPKAPKQTRIAEVDPARKSTIDQKDLPVDNKPRNPGGPPAGHIPNHGPHSGPRPVHVEPPKASEGHKPTTKPHLS